MPLSSVEEATEDIKGGRLVIIVDDEDRENEGDLAMLAEFASPQAIAFMATNGRGLICVPLAGEVCDELGLDPQVTKNRGDQLFAKQAAKLHTIVQRHPLQTEKSLPFLKLAELDQETALVSLVRI